MILDTPGKGIKRNPAQADLIRMISQLKKLQKRLYIDDADLQRSHLEALLQEARREIKYICTASSSNEYPPDARILDYLIAYLELRIKETPC